MLWFYYSLGYSYSYSNWKWKCTQNYDNGQWIHMKAHISDVIMGAMASTSRLFTQPFIEGADQNYIKAPRYWPFLRGIHWWPVNSPHKGPVTRKCFHLVTSSCVHYCRFLCSRRHIFRWSAGLWRFGRIFDTITNCMIKSNHAAILLYALKIQSLHPVLNDVIFIYGWYATNYFEKSIGKWFLMNLTSHACREIKTYSEEQLLPFLVW